jgi:hypothetical protein
MFLPGQAGYRDLRSGKAFEQTAISDRSSSPPIDLSVIVGMMTADYEIGGSRFHTLRTKSRKCPASITA